MDEPALAPSSLLVLHSKLDEIFLEHQELLLERRLGEATAKLEVYRELLELHMRHEEELLLPLYARHGPSKRWPLVLFTGQHQRMRELLDAVAERLRSMPAEVRPRDVIALLDFERTYKHLSEHHDGAEREGLFPALDRAMLDGAAISAEHAGLVRSCLREWEEAEARLRRG